MPTYSYACDDGHRQEMFMSIAEMLQFEATPQVCSCGQSLVRLLDVRRHISFHEGFFEHISEAGAHIANMSDLKRIAAENGNYSQYAEDLGGAFPRSNSGRWI